jgi:histidine triad (HIT) family protein
MSDKECIFCKISQGELTTDKVLETEELICFKDRSPSAEKHILLVPKKHIETFMELDDTMLLDKMRDAAQQLIRSLNLATGYRLVINGGRYQEVPHLHWHLLGGELKRPVP